MQRSAVWVLAAIPLLYLLFLSLQRSRPAEATRKRGHYGARRFLGTRHQAMYQRLAQAFSPAGCLVLAQVGLGALLVPRDGAPRKPLLEQRADFVILGNGMKVIAIIEMSDSGERGPVAESIFRDAGYAHLRYGDLPSEEELRAHLSGEGVQSERETSVPGAA